jgi:hypothetical protein
MINSENKKNSNNEIQVVSTINTNHSDMEKRLLLNENFNSYVIDNGLGHMYGSW